jgi:diadenosine tetraphosphate (Ap4A) HIT family hydrolase
MPTPWTDHVKQVASGGSSSAYQLVEIVWEDASAYAIQWTEEVEKESRLSLAVGYLMFQDEHVVSIAALMNTDQVGHGIVIPKSHIKSWRDLD